MQITDIVVQKKNKNRVSIFVDNEFAFGLSTQIRYEKNLEIGTQLTDVLVAELISLDQTQILFNKTLRFLSYRPRTSKEISDYLYSKVNSKELTDVERAQLDKSVAFIIAKLAEFEQINDTEFARWWVEQRNRFRPRGSRLLKMELKQKGISSEVIEQNISEAENWQNALAAGEKKLRSYQKLPDIEFRQKMSRYLARLGFDWEIIRGVIDTLREKR